MADLEDLNSRVAALEVEVRSFREDDLAQALQIADLSKAAASLDTQVDAQDQAIAAMVAVNRNRERLNTLNVFAHGVNRKLNAIACVGTGAFLMYLGNPLLNDASIVNDEIGKYLFLGGGAMITYGLLVMTSQEEKILNALTAMNPWRRG